MRSSSLTLAASNLLARGRQDEGAAGSSRKMDGAQARQKARERKAEALANLPEDVSISTIHY